MYFYNDISWITTIRRRLGGSRLDSFLLFMGATTQSSVLMSTSSHGGDSKFPVQEPRLSGVKAALRYTGIPPSWLDKRPSLPSRNWLIFLGVTSSIAGWYIYDRRQCTKIRQEYVDKVKHLSEVPLHSLDYPRKVTVYGSKWPGDEESDRSLRYFRKYVKVRASALLLAIQ